MFRELMKVTHVSYSVSRQTASFRLHSELSKRINSNIFVADKSINSAFIIQPHSFYEKISARIGIIRELIFQFFFPHNKRVYFSFNLGPLFIQKFWLKKLIFLKTDIYHLHWLGNGFVNINQIRNFKKPLVITLHDVWFFTGGCHVNLDCDKYLINCNKCPLFASNNSLVDITSIIFRVKKKLFEERKIHVIVLSKWMKERALLSPILSNSVITLIPNGIDTDKFKPFDKLFARNVFNLNPNTKILLFGGISAKSDYNKGYDLLCQSLNILKQKSEEFELVVFGNSDSVHTEIEGFKATFTGYLHDDESLALLYSAADLVLVPSRQESFSQVSLESISCGTPVIAFDYSGPKDIIQHKVNGYLARPYDSNDFADGISWFFSDKVDTSKVSSDARKIAETNFSLELVAQKHIDLYKKIIFN
jgi:glycosyltransferase involved in cell wall biosynthesis